MKCKREGCGQDVVWAVTTQGNKILLDAAPVEWTRRVFVFIDEPQGKELGQVRRAQKHDEPPYYGCHWEHCRE